MNKDKFKPTPVLDLGDIKMRSDLLKKRLIPVLDILVIANMKIERCVNHNQDIPQTMIDTRDKMYETALEILKSEGKPI